MTANRSYGEQQPKTHIVVPVFGIVPVTVGRTAVPVIVVPRPATQHES